MSHAVYALWKREIVKFSRDRSRIVGAVVQPLGFWLLLGLGFQGTFQMPVETASDIGYMEFLFPGIVTLVLLFTAIFSTISVVEERKEGFLQAALVAPVPRTAIVLGNTLGGSTLAVAEAFLFLLLIPLLGLAFSFSGMFVALLICLLTALAFTSLGLLIAWKMETTRGFHAVMNLFLLPMWFLSGSFFPAEGTPWALRTLMKANPVTYAVDGLRKCMYLPSPPPLDAAPLSVDLAIVSAFALVMLLLAVRIVRKPLF